MGEWSENRFKAQCCANSIAAYRANKRCLFPVWKDGYCRRHHPEVKLAVLKRQLARHQQAASELLVKIGQLERNQ